MQSLHRGPGFWVPALLLALTTLFGPPLIGASVAPAAHAQQGAPPPLLEGRRAMAVTSTGNGAIYVLAGQTSTCFSNSANGTTGCGGQVLGTVELYDPVTNTWTTRAPLPQPRFALGAATASNGKIYVAGGWSTDTTFFEEYDPTTDTWTTRAPMLSYHASFGLVAGSNGKIYAIGGEPEPSGGAASAAVEEYDPATNTWASKAPMPTARQRLAVAATANGKIYAIGGNPDPDLQLNSGHDLAAVEEYDLLTNTWMTRAPMPTARRDLGATVVNGKIYAIGGNQPALLFHGAQTVEEYDPSTNTWTTSAPMPTGRSELGVVASLGHVYAIGGFGFLGQSGTRITYGSLATVERYDPATSLWSESVAPALNNLTVSGDAAWTASTSVQLAIAATDNSQAGPTEMSFSNDGSTWGPWSRTPPPPPGPSRAATG